MTGPEVALGERRGRRALRHLTITQTLSLARSGGLVQVATLHRAMLDLGIPSRLVYADWEGGLAAPPASIRLRTVRGNPFFFGWDAAPKLRAAIREADAVHVHGLYTYLNLLAGAWCARYGKALIYHPHGALVPEFRRRGRVKKALALAAFERRNFRRMTAWRALSSAEARQIRDVAPGAEVFVVPNGVTLPRDATRVDGLHPRLSVRADPARRIFLYLARLSAVKGLDRLLEAWHQNRAPLAGCELWIAGVDRDGTEPALRKRVRSSRIGGVAILGPVSDAEKDWLLRACDVFVLPSRGEGQSPALLEAMAYGKPCLFTTACFFSAAVVAGAGLECTASVDDLGAGLRRFAAISAEQAAAMGRRARAFVAGQHDIRDVARALDDQVRRCCAYNARPDEVTS